MAHYFVSYSRKDMEFVARLSIDLQNAGVNLWIDNVGLVAGTPNWDEAIRNAIRGADGVIFIASPESRRSDYVRDEVALARNAKKPFYPVWSAGDDWLDCVPLGVGSTQSVDLRGASYAAGLAQLIGAIKGQPTAFTPVELQPTTPAALPAEPRNPYKGLRAFRAADSSDFFGREQLITELLAAVGDGKRSPRLHAVLGASGSGKSSVMMAGVLPKLHTWHSNWAYLDPIVPGVHPLENLAIALARQLPARSHKAIGEDLLDPATRGLHRLACEMSDESVVLYIDQFEEVFTLTTDEHERRQFLDVLTTAVNEPDGVLLVLLSMRADFYDRPAQYREFGALLENHHRLITPMLLADLYDVVEKPAELPDVGLAFEDRLVEEIVFAVREEASALPLMQFTLDQLFQQRDGHRLTRAAYSAMGGVKGALAKHAEATFQQLNTDQQRLVRVLFLRLIEPGVTPQDTTRRRASLTELTLADTAQTASMRFVTETFVDARLLTTDRAGNEEMIEVSHEALIREWARLGGWLHEAREDVLLMKRIAADAREWARKGQPEDALYRGRRLREAQDWAASNTASAGEITFIAAGAAAEQAQIAAEEQRKRDLRAAAERAELASAKAQQSADHAERQRRRARVAIGFAGAIIVIALIVGLVAAGQVSDASNQVANAKATLSPIPGTLAAADAQLSHATVTLGYVQDEGTAVSAQATYFGIEQARIGTLAAGAVVIPPGTLTPELLLPTLTGIAKLRAWQPRMIKDDFDVEIVEVPPGCFIMGSVTGGDEGPVHEQCFAESFYIDRYEVTNGQYERITKQTPPSNFTGDNRPVDSIYWFDARDFCAQRGARLPTEREWEYAARGPDSLAYPWGNVFVLENVIYNRVEDQGSSDVIDASGEPMRPGGASWVGALDMSGNVFEWTSTRYDDLDYSQQTLGFLGLFPYPYHPDDGREEDETQEAFETRAKESDVYTLRVLRGGAFDDASVNLRAANRDVVYPIDGSDYFGFRCARFLE